MIFLNRINKSCLKTSLSAISLFVAPIILVPRILRGSFLPTALGKQQPPSHRDLFWGRREGRVDRDGAPRGGDARRDRAGSGAPASVARRAHTPAVRDGAPGSARNRSRPPRHQAEQHHDDDARGRLRCDESARLRVGEIGERRRLGCSRPDLTRCDDGHTGIHGTRDRRR